MSGCCTCLRAFLTSRLIVLLRKYNLDKVRDCTSFTIHTNEILFPKVQLNIASFVKQRKIRKLNRRAEFRLGVTQQIYINEQTQKYFSYQRKSCFKISTHSGAIKLTEVEIKSKGISSSSSFSCLFFPFRQGWSP